MTTADLTELAKVVLTGRQFECWLMSRVHHRSYLTISYALDLDKSTVRGYVRRSDQKLDRWLRDNPS